MIYAHFDLSNRLISNRCGLAGLSEFAIPHVSGADSLVGGFCAALIVCEYFALLPREVELFWKRKITGASVLFLSNRYMSLLSEVIQNAAIGSISSQVRLSGSALDRVLDPGVLKPADTYNCRGAHIYHSAFPLVD